MHLKEPASPSIIPINLFGWTIGGTVALEYDTSPADGLPYREFVKLGGLALSWQSSKMLVGQYGTRLYVNETAAQDMCEKIWNLPAYHAPGMDFAYSEGNNENIGFEQDNETALKVTGWELIRRGESEKQLLKGLPLYWNPTITTIWANLLPSTTTSSQSDHDETSAGSALPLHKLRLSGSPRLRLVLPRWKDQQLPLGVDVILQNLLIEISHPLN